MRPVPTPRRALRSCLLALGVLASISPVANAAEFNTYRLQGETIPAVPRIAAPAVDAAATGGAAYVLSATGAGSRRFIAPSLSRIDVRVRAVACDGSPTLAVEVDGQEVLRSAVESATYSTRSVTLPAATSNDYHTLTVRMLDGLKTAACTRTIHVDELLGYSTFNPNTGTLGSICQGTDRGQRNPPAVAGYSTTRLGPGPNGLYYEVGEPSGAYAGKAPKGIMMLVHGGGWLYVGPPEAAKMRGNANRWRALGWRTVSITYGACGRSLADVIAFHDLIASTFAAEQLPMCSYGESAGGHLTLMLAASRRLHCAINGAGPTDFNALYNQVAQGPYGPWRVGPRRTYHWAVAAFGRMDPTRTLAQNLATYSPVTYAGSIGERVLQGAVATDHLVPVEQVTGMDARLDAVPARAGNPAQHHVLAAPGDAAPIYWVHNYTTVDEVKRFHALEQAAASGL